MKSKDDFVNANDTEKELRIIKDQLSNILTQIKEIDIRIPEETKNAKSLVNSLAQLKGRYRDYETTYNDIVSKTTSISNAAQEADGDIAKIREAKDKIQEISTQADEIKEAIAANPDIVDDIDNMNEQITNVGALYSQAEKDKNEIRKLYQALFGYNVKDSETGETKHVDGLKQQLDSTYDNLKTKMETLEKETKQNFTNTINEWSGQYNALKESVENLLPGAMSAGLAEAYKDKRERETKSYRIGYCVFVGIIVVLIAVALIPVIVVTQSDLTLLEAIKDAPMLTMTLSPVYAALIWLGIFQNKKLNLSKKLIEEYSHKEATAKTYAGLAKQVADVGDDEMSKSLKIKLLEQTLNAAAQNPSECITNHEKSDNPIMSLLNMSSKWVNRAGGTENVAKLLDTIAKMYLNYPKQQKSDDADKNCECADNETEESEE